MRSLFSYQKLKVHLFLGVSQGYAFEFFDCLFFFFSLGDSHTVFLSAPACSFHFLSSLLCGKKSRFSY